MSARQTLGMALANMIRSSSVRHSCLVDTDLALRNENDVLSLPESNIESNIVQFKLTSQKN